MEWFEVEQNGNRKCEFPERNLPGYDQMLTKPVNERGISSDYIGGIINHGRWGWLTRQHDEEATLLICDLDNGYRVAHYTFWRAGEKAVTDSQRSIIRCVEELFPSKPSGRSLLAICIQMGRNKSKIAIYTPCSSQVLRYIPLDSGMLVSSMAFLDERLCERTAMLDFDGCLAVGTELGTVLFVDINAAHVVDTRNTNLYLPDANVLRAELMPMPFEGVMSANRINSNLLYAREQNMHLSLELDLFGRSDVSSSICSLLPIDIISGIAAGMKDGRIFIYDLNECKLLKMWGLPGGKTGEAVERLCCIVPPDDPMPCFYLCAISKKNVGLMTSLYSINYSKSVVRAESDQILLLNFQSVSTRMCLMLDDSRCSLMGCNTASTFAFAGDNGTLLTAISWYSHTEEKNKLILFDINQWYKDEMPSQLRPNEKPNYICGYVLSGRQTGLGLRLNVRSISPFLTLHRCDEHFYPNSLSFDCSLMTITGCRQYQHVGVQRRFLDSLYTQKANLFLNPQPYLHEMMRIRLMPQFCDYKEHDVLNQREVYEVIFSMVLEHDCVGLLSNCAKYCLDGSFLCNMLNEMRLTLSTLTSWIVTRAGLIKTRCAELCHGIFDFGGYSLDEREREEYKELNRQLLVLQQLEARIIKLGKNSLAPEQLEDLQTTDQTLTTLYEFQCVLYWLIERGLLPEGHESASMAQQPLQLIRREYAERRSKLSQTRLKLYIDEMLQLSGLKVALEDRCLEDGNYPPHSLQAYMQLMLLSDAKLLHKQELLLYMLFDVDQLSSQRSLQLSQDFIKSFDLADSLVCTVKCFWFMDRVDFEPAIKSLYDRLDKSANLEDWQIKMLIEVLLANGANKDALQLVYRPPGRITSELHLKVLLTNHNIPEAFHFARLYYDESGKSLLEYFFEHIIRSGKYSVLASLCLREHEEQLVYRLLRQCKTRQTDTVQLILLLKRSKYIEAVSFMDEVAAEQRRGPNAESLSEETNSILSAYRATMAPVTQTIAGAYFRIRNNLSGDQLRNVSLEPFSCQLAKQNASGKLSNIFQSSALNAHWATRYRNEQQPRALNSRNMPFLRNAAQATSQLPQRPRLVRPTPYQFVEKRTLHHTQRAAGSEQASKRRRLLGDQFETDVNGFLKRFGAQVEQQSQELEMETEEPEVLQQPHLVTALLQAPVYLQFKAVNAQPVAEVQRRRAPPTILKRRASMRIAEQTTLAAPAAAPATAVRNHDSFRLLATMSEGVSDHDVSAMEQGSDLEEQEEEEETDEIIVEIEQQPTSPTPSPQLNPDQSSESVSDSEYLSPLPSESVSFAAAQKVTDPFATPSGPQPRSSLFFARTGQSSSGFGSFATVHMGNTNSLQLNDFVPPSCSSKMFDVESAQLRTNTQTVSSTAMHVKISERSTICVDTDEPSAVTASGVGLWNMPTVLTPAVQPIQMSQPLRMLDTTLSMSSYDMTALEVAQEKEPEPGAEPEEKSETELATQAVSESGIYAEQQLEAEPVPAAQLQSAFEPLIVDQAPSMLPLEYIDLDDEDDEEQQTRAEQQQLDVEQSSSSSSEDAIALDYNQASPSYSLSSELSEMSEVASLLPSRQDAPVFSIVVESTNSITTSRSPTSHTPTSFLPSDTNVSQNSSPRAAHGGAADGSNRSLYRANSLETVDDLDTTKGSLEEEEDNDEEDDCVIALDGTEVRGYVARPEPAAACSSAELFAFKKQDETLDEATQLPSAASLGATANSDSVQAYTINLDSVDSAGEHEAAQIQSLLVPAAASEVGTSNDSVDTVAYSEHKQQLNEAEAAAELQLEYKQTEVELPPKMQTEMVEHAEAVQAVNMSSQDVEMMETAEDLEELPEEIQLNLELAKNRDAASMEAINISGEDVSLQQPIAIVSVMEPSNSSQLAQKRPELKTESSEAITQSISPDSDVELPTAAAKSSVDITQPLTVDSDDESNHSLKLSVSDNEESEQQQQLDEQLKKFSEKSAVVRIQRARRSVSGTPPPATAARRIRLRSDDLSQAEDLSARDTPSPVSALRRTRRLRSGSLASVASEDLTPTEAPRDAVAAKITRRRRSTMDSATTVGSEGTSPEASVDSRSVTQGRRRLRSSDSQLSALSGDSTSRPASRAGSLPPLSTMPVSTPKRRKRQLGKHLESIQEMAEGSPLARVSSRTRLAQVNSPIVVGDAALDKERKVRGRSEPAQAAKPATKSKRSIKTSVSEEQEPGTSAGRSLRSRRQSVTLSPEMSKVSEANVPLKKRGRPKK